MSVEVSDSVALGPSYGYGGRIDSIRANEFDRLGVVAYLDHAGVSTTIHPPQLHREHVPSVVYF